MKAMYFNIIIYIYFLTDGIIAINKPYGISIIQQKVNANQPQQLTHKIVGAVNYSIQDVLPYLAKELDVPILIPCFGSERYIILPPSSFPFLLKNIIYFTCKLSFL